jgi:hypothetical protein
MKTLVSLMLLGSLAAQNLNESEINTSHELGSQQPKAKVPFELNYHDIRERIHLNYIGGRIDVEFIVNKKGEVENPVILDTFNVYLNDVVLDKVRQSKYYPATQNGNPVRVKYKLPIVFK